MAEQEKPKEEKTRRDNFWESMGKTFHTAATGAQRYTRLVQKKIDLATTQRKIPAVHGELGKLIDDLHARARRGFGKHRGRRTSGKTGTTSGRR